MHYSKPSQTSKMKLLVKVVNASRDVFKTVISIQNVFRTSRMALFYKNNEHKRPKAVNFFRKKLHLNILLGPKNASGFSLFSPKTAS